MTGCVTGCVRGAHRLNPSCRHLPDCGRRLHHHLAPPPAGVLHVQFVFYDKALLDVCRGSVVSICPTCTDCHHHLRCIRLRPISHYTMKIPAPIVLNSSHPASHQRACGRRGQHHDRHGHLHPDTWVHVLLVSMVGRKHPVRVAHGRRVAFPSIVLLLHWCTYLLCS